MTIAIIFLIAVGVCVVFGAYAQRRQQNALDEQYAMFAGFAREWHITRLEAEKKLRDVRVVVLEAERDKQFQAVVVQRYEEDIERYVSYINHWRGMIPQDRRSEFNCP